MDCRTARLSFGIKREHYTESGRISTVAKTQIPNKIQVALWARAGGRCEYRGCNEDLIGDLIAGREDGKFGFIAHIVADSADGPRGDPLRSPALSKNLNNLMLLCAKHHKGVDVDYLADHPESVLLEMKAEHEDRIAIVTGMAEERAAHVLRFAADIGQRDALVSIRSIFMAMPPDRHPAEGRTIDIELVGCDYADHEETYWTIQQDNLRRVFARKVKERIEQKEIRQLSVFALAPQPLLIELGHLLGDIVPVTVHQRYREPPTWRWQPNQPAIAFQIGEYSGPADVSVALKLALSATVTDDRLRAVLGEDVAIWSLTAEARTTISCAVPRIWWSSSATFGAYSTRSRLFMERMRSSTSFPHCRTQLLSRSGVFGCRKPICPCTSMIRIGRSAASFRP